MLGARQHRMQDRRPNMLTKLQPLPLVTATASVIVAGLAQSILREPPRAFGWLLYLAAAAIFIVGFRNLRLSEFAAARSTSSRGPKLRPSGPAPGAALVSIAIGALSFVLLISERTQLLGWLTHLLSLAVFVVGISRTPNPSQQPEPSAPLRSRALSLALLLAILALAAFCRLWQLDHFPFGFWVDEADNGLAAVQILNDPAFRPLYFASTNAPAHFNYLIAMSFSFLGVNPFAQRLVAATFGIVAVLFAYLLFRRWMGPTMGAFAAVLLAVMRYHLTFSRFGVQVIATTTFELAALYFLDRALAHRKPMDFAGFGLSIGLGLAFYTAFRLFPIALLVGLMGMLVGYAIRHGFRSALERYVLRLSSHWIIAALALVLSAAPVAAAAISEPDAFFSRTGTVSIFEKRDEPNLARALASNTVKHLEMFNVAGDRNGRHNLPGAPMLDPIMGALFVVGAAFALWRWRDPPNVLMLCTFFIMLLAGILSLDFEAPQALRSVGVIPAVVYFSVLPVAAVHRALTTAFRPRQAPRSWGIPRAVWQARHAAWGLLLVGVLAGIAVPNLNTFFVKQQSDQGVWSSYSTAETIVAQEWRRTVDDFDPIVSAGYDVNRTIRFLVGDVSNVQRWKSTDRLPLVREASDRGAVLMLDNNVLSAYRDAQRIYTSAQFIEHTPPQGGNPIMVEVILSPEVLRSVQGADATYFSGESPSAAAVQKEDLDSLKVDWKTGAPLAEPFLCELRTILVVKEFGEYRFTSRGDLQTSLWIDEFPISSEPIQLALGTHTLRWQITGGNAAAELLWQPPSQTAPQPVPPQNLFVSPVTNSGLLGAYYPTPDWSGPPAFTQVDPQLAYYFHIIPLPRPYSVRWTGRLFAPGTGTYEFEIFSVDDSRLILDQEIVVDNPGDRKSVTGSALLSHGWHDIQVDFSDRTSGTQIYLYWTPPGGERELVPPRYLSPPMGAYPASP
jgi:hypothetical protein